MSEPEITDGASESRADDAAGCGAATHALTAAELAADVETLSAVANGTRYEALRLVADAEGDRCVCELEPALGVSQGAVSQALSRLSAADLLTRRKEGRWRYYGTTPRADRLLAALDGLREATDE